MISVGARNPMAPISDVLVLGPEISKGTFARLMSSNISLAFGLVLSKYVQRYSSPSDSFPVISLCCHFTSAIVVGSDFKRAINSNGFSSFVPPFLNPMVLGVTMLKTMNATRNNVATIIIAFRLLFLNLSPEWFYALFTLSPRSTLRRTSTLVVRFKCKLN